MKRIILVLVVILISTNTLHAANFKWTKIETSDDGEMTVYVDKKTVFRVGSYKYFWLLSDYLNPSEDPESTDAARAFIVPFDACSMASKA